MGENSGGDMSMNNAKFEMPSQQQALPGREQLMPLPEAHSVSGVSMRPPYPEGLSTAMFGLGCFWGAERMFWTQAGVYLTAVGYAGGYTPNPSYEEVCSGLTGHNEVVWLLFDAEKISYDALLKVFWESHNPTQGMRQGNDRGTQYRSGIYAYDDAQERAAQQSAKNYQMALSEADFGNITTEILAAPRFYFAEEYHQQYLAKNPMGYCGLGGCGVPLR